MYWLIGRLGGWLNAWLVWCVLVCCCLSGGVIGLLIVGLIGLFDCLVGRLCSLMVGV